MKQCLSFWKNDLKASKFIIDVIEFGYKIPFISVPPQFFAKNNRSSLNHPEFVESAISDLLIKRCIVETEVQPYCCNPLTVSEGKKLRLVLDLRHPNQYVQKFKFKYEDLSHIVQVLDKDQYYFSFDLESGYHHVDIFPLHQKFLGFSWKHKVTITKFYVFTVLPFGLSSASYLFTKLTRPLVYYWRANGLISFVYIDDGIIVNPSLDLALTNSPFVRNTIARSGFVASKTKCVWTPRRSILILGLIIDSLSSSFYIPQIKIAKLLSCISGILLDFHSSNSIPVKTLACFTGQVISMSLALGPIARLMTRCSYRAIESRIFWSDSIFLPDSVLNELRFWSDNVSSLNGFPFRFRLVPSFQVFSDASNFGYGGHVQGYPNLRVHGLWLEAEKLTSSTWRELTAVFRVLSELRSILTGHKIKWFSDNSNVPLIIKCGSVKADLHDIALSIFTLCKSSDIVIIPEWLPRNENIIADKISKFRDFDDWSIDSHSFSQIDCLWGPHTIDRFASPHNAKLSVFNARFWCRGVFAVDAFCQDWTTDNNYFCPPVSLIVQVIRKMRISKVIGTLVVPRWPSAHFWPFICPDGSHLDPHVSDWRLLKVSFVPPSLGEKSVFCLNPSFLTLALRFNYKIPPRPRNAGFCCSDLGYCDSCIPC